MNKLTDLTGGNIKLKVLVDADLLLELFANRDGYVEGVERLLTVAQSQHIQLYITEWCLRKIYLYLGGVDEQLGKDASNGLKIMFRNRIIPINNHFKSQARALSLSDFESAIELACAIDLGLDAIVSQNPKNFATAPLQILSVEHLYFLHQQLEKSYQRDILNQTIRMEYVRWELEMTWLRHSNHERLEYRKSIGGKETLQNLTLNQRLVAGVKAAGVKAIEELLSSHPVTAVTIVAMKVFLNPA